MDHPLTTRWRDIGESIIARLALENAKDLSDDEMLRCFKHCDTSHCMLLAQFARDSNLISLEIVKRVREEMVEKSVEVPKIAPNQTHTVPNLESFCGSWIVVSRDTGESVLEIYSRDIAERVNQEKYEVLTAYQWLARFNQRARTAGIEGLDYTDPVHSPPAALLGRKGGQAKTPAKTRASQSNGKKGGRPKQNRDTSAFD